jgi:hypothetical protein
MFALPVMFFAYVVTRLLLGTFMLLVGGGLLLFAGVCRLGAFGWRHAQAWLRRYRQRRALGVR